MSIQYFHTTNRKLSTERIVIIATSRLQKNLESLFKQKLVIELNIYMIRKTIELFCKIDYVQYLYICFVKSRSRQSSHCFAIAWIPIGSVSFSSLMVPKGTEIAGSPARFAGTV